MLSAGHILPYSYESEHAINICASGKHAHCDSDLLLQILHWVRHALQKRNRQGLLAAMNNMQSELMCLGFATLILLTFQSSITGYCSASLSCGIRVYALISPHTTHTSCSMLSLRCLQGLFIPSAARTANGSFAACKITRCNS